MRFLWSTNGPDLARRIREEILTPVLLPG
jgi:hypothetical protein